MNPENVIVLPLEGVCNLPDSSDFDKQVQQALTNEDASIVVDCSEARYMNSQCMSVLMHACGVLMRRERRLHIVAPPSSVLRSFEVVGLKPLVALYETRDEAVAAAEEELE